MISVDMLSKEEENFYNSLIGGSLKQILGGIKVSFKSLTALDDIVYTQRLG